MKKSMVNCQLSIALLVNFKNSLAEQNSRLTIHFQYYTNALKPVIDLPTISELISFVPS